MATNTITSDTIIDAPRGNSHYGRQKDFYFLPQILGFTYNQSSHRARHYLSFDSNGPLNIRMSWQRRAPKPLLLDRVDESGNYIFRIDKDSDEEVVFDLTKSGDYTPSQIDRFTDAILRADAKVHPIKGENPILFDEHIMNRKRREIQVGSGTPDKIDGLDNERGIHKGDGQKIFNRTHPQGRKVNSAHQRRVNGASYYR